MSSLVTYCLSWDSWDMLSHVIFCMWHVLRESGQGGRKGPKSNTRGQDDPGKNSEVEKTWKKPWGFNMVKKKTWGPLSSFAHWFTFVFTAINFFNGFAAKNPCLLRSRTSLSASKPKIRLATVKTFRAEPRRWWRYDGDICKWSFRIPVSFW